MLIRHWPWELTLHYFIANQCISCNYNKRLSKYTQTMTVLLPVSCISRPLLPRMMVKIITFYSFILIFFAVLLRGEEYVIVDVLAFSIQRIYYVDGWLIMASRTIWSCPHPVTTILDKIVAEKLTPYGKIIPRAPVTMLKHKIVLLVTYRPQHWRVGAGEKYRFVKGFNLATSNRCIS